MTGPEPPDLSLFSHHAEQNAQSPVKSLDEPSIHAVTEITAKPGAGRGLSGRHAKERDKPKTRAVRLKRVRADERIPEILDAATAAFIDRGFAGTTMEDIAARLGVSKPILYRRFESKHVLLEKVLDRGLTRRYAQTSEAIRNYTGSLKPLIQALRPHQSGTGADAFCRGMREK